MVAFVMLLWSCGEGTPHESSSDNDIIEVVELTINVDGMTCEGCESTVNSTLVKLSGVQHALASHIEKTVVVLVDTNVTSVIEMQNAIEKVGYTLVN